MSCVDRHELDSTVPPLWRAPFSLREAVHQHRVEHPAKLVVLDDDPMGAQTLSDVQVLTDWRPDNLQVAFRGPDHLFYVLTNTRAYGAAQAKAVNREVVEAVQAVARQTGVPFELLSRSDSTLRGHYPLDIDVMAHSVMEHGEREPDAHLVVPAYLEEGRVTYHGVQYLERGTRLIPVSETEYAQDHAFGFRTAKLADWIEEKSAGRIRASDCLELRLETVRQGPEAVVAVLRTTRRNTAVICDALSYADLDVLSIAVLQARGEGKRLLFRTASSFIKSYSGQPEASGWIDAVPVPLALRSRGALVIVGSHASGTTRQLEHALATVPLHHQQLNVERLMRPTERARELARVAGPVATALDEGRHAVVSTTRVPVRGVDPAGTLQIGQAVSDALVALVQSLGPAPRMLVVKGGVTAREIAVRGLSIRRAHVLGQIVSGVSVWHGDSASRWAGMPYIVFPGNVGEDVALYQLLKGILPELS